MKRSSDVEMMESPMHSESSGSTWKVYTSDSMLAILKRDLPHVFIFLQCLGIYWPRYADFQESSPLKLIWNGFIAVWYIISKFTSYVTNPLAMAYIIGPRTTGGSLIVDLLVEIVVYCQAVTLLYACYWNEKSLHAISENDVTILRAAFRSTMLFFVIDVIITPIQEYAVIADGFAPNIVTAFSVPYQIVLGNYLTLNMFFVSVDMAMCEYIMDSLLQKVKNNTIREEDAIDARISVIQRVGRSMFQNSAVSVVAFMNVATIIVFLLVKGMSSISILFVIGVFSKEFFFIAILLLKSAFVNAHFQTLLADCSCYLMDRGRTETDHIRLSKVLIYLQHNPLHYPVIGRVWSFGMIATQVLVFTVGIAVSIVKEVFIGTP